MYLQYTAHIHVQLSTTIAKIDDLTEFISVFTEVMPTYIGSENQ